MNTPKNLSDEALLTQTQKLARLERKISVRLIHHLQEVERRHLHLQRGFSSLYDYLITELHYSGGAADRRIKAMHACQAVPELSSKIESGQLNLTQLVQLQSQIEYEEKKGQPISSEAKRDLAAKLEGLSTRETEKLLAARTPEKPKKDTQRATSATHTRLSFDADEELLKMIQRLKELRPTEGLLELFKLTARETLKRIDPLQKVTRAKNTTPTPAPGRRPNAATRHALTLRDEERCRYTDPKTHRRCRSRRLIQSEHKIPWAQGGPTELPNLEQLCAPHNRLRAIQAYGPRKMAPYLTKPKTRAPSAQK